MTHDTIDFITHWLDGDCEFLVMSAAEYDFVLELVYRKLTWLPFQACLRRSFGNAWRHG
jgi:hypothetical protein